MAFASVPSKLSTLLISLVVLASLTLSEVAEAQSIDPILDSSIDRDQEFRGANENPFWINYDDCIKNDALTFSLGLRDNSGYTLQVWAVGNGDCTDKGLRSGTDADCWLVFEDQPTELKFDAKIPVRNIVAQRNKGSDTVTVGTIDDCENSGSANGDSRRLWFMLVDGNGDVKGTAQSYDSTSVDLSGPAAPEGLTATGGERRLQVDWTSNATDDLEQYELYCVASTAAATASVPRFPLQASTDAGSDAATDASIIDASTTDDAGATGAGGSGGAGGSSTGGGGGSNDTDAGSDGGSSGSSTGSDKCGFATPLVPGERPSADLERCGTASRTGSGGIAKNLINGVRYAVAAAGVDKSRNRGPLSDVACGTPEVIDDFFELYERAGGKGGGGFCAVHPGEAASSAAWWLLSLVGAVGIWRRRAAQ
jgi:MYXO-CTERM domain-containing protein